MDRPVRRSRQRAPPSGLIGLLPQEEAAINRALHESLIQKKKKYTRHRPSVPAATTPPISSDTASAPNKRKINQVLTEQGSYSDPTDGPSSSSSTTLPQKRRRLHSPLSPSHSLESLSSESKPSSPTRGNGGTGGVFGRHTSSSSLSSPRSVESSLKLVLSPTSWSRSSSSSWSPTPEPNVGTGPSKGSAVGKVAPTKKTPGNKKSSLPKAKPTLAVSTTEEQPKRKRGRPRKYPPKETTKTPPKLGKGGKARGGGSSTGLTKGGGGKTPKTYTKLSLQYHGGKMVKRKQQSVGKQGRGGGQSGGRGLLRPMSPEAALVLHDHCYNMEQMDQGEAAIVEDDAATNSQTDIRSSPYAAQRKFAQNQAPCSTPTKLTRDEVEGMSRFKEIPKTEDFITFLCLRGSDSMPKELEKFSFPWTQLQRRKSKGNNGKLKSRNVAKKLGESLATSSPVTAIH